MFAAWVSPVPGRVGAGVPPRRPPFFVRVGAFAFALLRRWRTDPDVRQYEQRREAMAALGRASVVASPSVHPAVADFGRPGHTL